MIDYYEVSTKQRGARDESRRQYPSRQAAVAAFNAELYRGDADDGRRRVRLVEVEGEYKRQLIVADVNLGNWPEEAIA